MLASVLVGGADVSLDRLRRQPHASTVLHRAHPAQLLLRPLLVVVPQVGVEHAALSEHQQ